MGSKRGSEKSSNHCSDYVTLALEGVEKEFDEQLWHCNGGFAKLKVERVESVKEYEKPTMDAMMAAWLEGKEQRKDFLSFRIGTPT